MLQETADRAEIIERVVALNIGQAEMMCCLRVPREGRPGWRLQGGGGVSDDDLALWRDRISFRTRLTDIKRKSNNRLRSTQPWTKYWS